MKLRLTGNSLRLRVTRSEVVRLRDHGVLEESADFGSGEILSYRIESRAGAEPTRVDFRNGLLLVVVPSEIVRVWTFGDDVGIYAQAGAMGIAIEKDFHCLTRPLDEQEADTFPNPSAPRQA